MDVEQKTYHVPIAASWADFTPPVMTTPFANGASLNVSPTEPLVEPVSDGVDPGAPSLSQGFQSPGLPITSPDLPVAPEPSPIEIAAEAALTEATPVPSAPTEEPNLPIPESPVTPPSTPISPTDDPSPENANQDVSPTIIPDSTSTETAPAALDAPSNLDVAAEPVTVSESEPLTEQEQSVKSVIPAILETPELPVGDPSLSLIPTPAAPTTTSQPRPAGRSFWPWFAGGLITVLIAGGLGYLYYNNAQVVPLTPTSQNGVENLTILQNSQGPDSWEKNYSTSLLASERGGLEFVVTDPPATPSATPSAKAALSASQSGLASKVDLRSLKITIAKVEVHLATQSIVATGTAPEATKSASKAVDHWETLRLNDATTVDLMKLRTAGGGLSSLGVTYLAAGHYTEIRLYVTSASGTLSDGTLINITIPGQNGLVKLVKSFDVSATGTAKLIADFDAPNSVVSSGSTYQLAPVVGRVIFNSKEI